MILPGPVPFLVPQEVQAPAPRPPRAQALASVVLVRTRLGGARVHQGSGVVVAPGLVVTNAHVATGGFGTTVHAAGGVWAVTQIRADAALDLCLLTVPGLVAPAALPAPEPEAPGQPVMAVGFPGGQPGVTQGHLRGIWHHGEGRLLQSDAPTHPGSSGGGLFDGQGRLLGLTTLTFTTSPRLNFSVPWARIQAFLAEPEAGGGGRDSDRGDFGVDLMERLAADPRNAPAWEAAARQWVEDRPEDPQAWLALGLALDRAVRVAADGGESPSRPRLQEAAAAYRRSLALQGSPRVWNNLGVVLDLLDRPGEAEGAFREALAQTPGYALAWFNLGAAQMNGRRFSEAAAALQQGLALRPDEAEAWGRLAACRRMQGQREAAAEAYEVALRYRPLAADLWLEFGTLLVDLGRWERVREVQVRLADLDPGLEARLNAAARSVSGAVRRPRGR